MTASRRSRRARGPAARPGRRTSSGRSPGGPPRAGRDVVALTSPPPRTPPSPDGARMAAAGREAEGCRPMGHPDGGPRPAAFSGSLDLGSRLRPPAVEVREDLVERLLLLTAGGVDDPLAVARVPQPDLGLGVDPLVEAFLAGRAGVQLEELDAGLGEVVVLGRQLGALE